MDWIPIVLVTFKVLVLGTGMFFAIKWHYDQGTKERDMRAVLRAGGKVAAVFPGATPAGLLDLVQWPLSKTPMLVIGHQPTLGQTIAQLLGFQESDCAIKKGALWWLRTRERDGQVQTVVVSVQSPELL